MALYTNESKERVRDAVDMVDLVSARVELKRAGANRMTGLCPFHDERTPSFGINPADKLYYCFGCQASGDAFTFVMETEGVDFKGAIELLADRYKVTLELEDEDPRAAEQRQRRERLLELLERTATYYARQLWESAQAAKAREYLTGRGLQEATLREFRVGYAPSAWDTVISASRRAGFGNRELYDAGLAQRSQSNGRIYDRFRSQIIFPLADARGRVRGFAGRTMGDGSDRRPKYINSPESDLFHKGRQLFAADLARAPAAKAQHVIAAEGYTDVIAMHQVGVRNTVGIMGTALTEDQIGELARLAPEVKLALDADSAGQDAMLRAARIALGRKPPLRIRVVPLPPGEDPADLVQRAGADEIKRRVSDSVPFVRFRVLRALDTGNLAEAEGRDRVSHELSSVFALLAPSAEREELRRIAADRLDLSSDLLERVLTGGSHGIGQGGGGSPPPRSQRVDARGDAGAGVNAEPSMIGRRDPTERSFLALCVGLPELGGPALAELDPEADLTSDVARRAVAYLRVHLRAPTAGLDELVDDELAALIRELVVRATAMTSASPSDFEIERLQLALARVGREITAARSHGEPIGALAARRTELSARLDRLMEQV
ncbi:MAG: DNA primase [Solirubrobacteraceae bacterium]|nr:DNA primase [Solirubrobacteraceae bacterium]